MNRFRLAFQVGVLLADILLANGAFLVAYYLRFETGLLGFAEYHPLSSYFLWMGLQSLGLPALLFFRGLYRYRRRISRVDEFWKVTTTVSLATVVVMAASSFLDRDFPSSRLLIVLSWALSIVLVWLGRVGLMELLSHLLRRGADTERVVIVGSGEMARVIAARIEGAPELGYRLVGFVNDGSPLAQDEEEELPRLGTIEELRDLVHAHGVRELIIADPTLSHQRVLEVVSQCERDHVNIKLFPDVFQIISSEVSIGDLNGMPMLSVRDAALRGWNLSLKRVVDVIISVSVLVLLAPLLLLIALLIKLTSPRGSVFYVQERVGLDGERFPLLKFRSMIPHAEAETGPVWAQRADPRVTPLGHWLRRFSLDELPQFVNVLLGQMSVVGPRPERPHFVEEFSKRLPRYFERHREKAGLTGWAQVNGLRGNVSIEERTAYDVWYVENWTLGLDFKIMLRTLIALFRDRNAY